MSEFRNKAFIRIGFEGVWENLCVKDMTDDERCKLIRAITTCLESMNGISYRRFKGDVIDAMI